MGSVAKQIMHSLFHTDIFKGYVPEFPEDLHGGGFPEIFRELVQELSPRIVIEVGSWKGRSAILLAKLLKQYTADGAVICVDTWLGCLEHLPPEISESWSIQRYRSHGYPRLYQQFLSNVVRAGVEDCIVPFPNTSHIAAQWLQARGVRADLVFIDGSHEYPDVLDDLNSYYPLLTDRGVIVGDDYSGFEGVARAVNVFAEERGLRVDIREGQLWIIRNGVGAPALRKDESPLAARSVVKRLAHRLGYRITRLPPRRST